MLRNAGRGILFVLVYTPLLFTRAESGMSDLPPLLRLDVLAGLLIAVVWVLAYPSENPSPTPNRRIAVRVGAIWFIISGSLAGCHWTVSRIRTPGPEIQTESKVWALRDALGRYAKDCGNFPSEKQGLEALRVNPGVAKWAGPYWDASQTDLDAWGNPPQYTVRDGVARICSAGPDGQMGTDDDIFAEISLTSIKGK